MTTPPPEPSPAPVPASIGVAPSGPIELSIWRRPISYRAQCWVAWAGLTAFGVRGAWAVYQGGEADVERVTALGLSVAWGIDLLRGRSAER